MKFYIFALLLTITLASGVKEFLSDTEFQQFKQIQNSKWGSIIVELAELNALAEGPIEDLKKALGNLVHDLSRQRKATSKQYDRQSLVHTRTVQTLSASIASAQNDIIQTTSRLQNVLIPAKFSYESNIKNLRNNIASNLKNQARENAENDAAVRRYNAIAAEHQQAIKDLDMCIRVVDGLKNPSLAQVSTLHSHLRRVQRALKNHDKYTPMINAILEVSSSKNLKDMNAIRGCLKLLNELRQSIVDDLNAYTAEEKARFSAFTKRLNALKDELAEFRRQLAANIAGLSKTNTQIAAAKAFIALRTGDKKSYTRQLKTENSNWVTITNIYEETMKDINDELSGAKQTLGFLNNANFGSYLKSKVNAAKVKVHLKNAPKRVPKKKKF